MKKRINEIPPYMNSDWSMNKETCSAEIEHRRLTNYSKMKANLFRPSFLSGMTCNQSKCFLPIQWAHAVLMSSNVLFLPCRIIIKLLFSR